MANTILHTYMDNFYRTQALPAESIELSYINSKIKIDFGTY